MARKISITLIVALLIFVHNDLYALNVTTHKAINLSISEGVYNGFSLDSYLKSNLGLILGIKETISENKTVQQWLELGGEYEDIPYLYMPYLRSVNHYHNPVTNRGFSGIFGGIFLSGMSAMDWATLEQGRQRPGGYYSWADVRNYYYLALTSSNESAREGHSADTFRGLGQLMHLVQDMGVPEHARDDGHLFYNYEHWVGFPGNVDISAIAPEFFGDTFSSISSLFDNIRYNGTNPDVTLDADIGLSEFTNANFLSWDTMFTGFQYPSLAGVELWTDPSNDRRYLKKTSEAVPVEHLAAVSFLYSYRLRYFPQNNEYLPLGMDSKVYADYASILLPRAVGYSADLLKHFFRAQLDMTADPDTAGQYVIKNLSGENMSGAFSLYYDDTDNNRNFITSWSLPISANGQSSPVAFTIPTSPEPKEKGKYILVFRGALGGETNAVAGRAVKLCETDGAIEVAITGPDAPVNGTCYTASNGTEPYAWSYQDSQGRTDGISANTGCITFSNQCGAATITATDSCGNAGTKAVRMPGGVWLFDHHEGASNYYNNLTDFSCANGPYLKEYHWAEVYIPLDWPSYYVSCTYPPPWMGFYQTMCTNPCSGEDMCPYVDGLRKCSFLMHVVVRAWRCY